MASTFIEKMNQGLKEKAKIPMGFANAAKLKSEWRDIHLGDYASGGRDDSRYIRNIWDFGAPQIASTGMANPDYVAGALPHGRPRETLNKTWDAYYGYPEAKHDIARAGPNYNDVEDYWDNIMFPVANIFNDLSWNNLGVGDSHANDYYAKKRSDWQKWKDSFKGETT